MEIIDSYKTIKERTLGEYKEKGSKFISYAFEIESEEDFKEVLDSIKKEHFKARHHCYAYVIGVDEDQFRYNDDGEPGGTAGLPIFNQLKSFNLKNIGVVVVRYFGGTKLGVPGLIRAYKSATIDALENAKIITKYIKDSIEIAYDYDYSGAVSSVVNSYKTTDLEYSFDPTPKITFKIRKSLTTDVVKSIYSAVLNRSINDIKDDEKVEGLKIKIEH